MILKNLIELKFNADNIIISNIISNESLEISKDTYIIIKELIEKKSIFEISNKYNIEENIILDIIENLKKINLVENNKNKFNENILFEKIENKIFDNFDENKEILFLGLPYDGASSGNTGSKIAPTIFRNYLSGFSKNIIDYNFNEKKFKMSFNNNIFDYGNILYIPGESSSEIHYRIEKAILKLKSNYNKFIFLGGDHSITYPLVKSFSEDNIILIKFDAHYDCSLSLDNFPINHHNYINKIRELKNVKNIIHIGVREILFNYHNISNDIIIKNIDSLTSEFINKISKNNKIYITIDIDILDPLENPGTAFKIPYGININTLIKILRMFKNKNIIAIDIVEYNPLMDNNSKSLKNLLDIFDVCIEILGGKTNE